MRGRFLLLVIVCLFIGSCEDPTTLPATRIFTNNKIQAVYVDTFSVTTSIVQLDSVLTSGSGTVLLGKYKDEQLGTVAASPYFQICYPFIFQPDTRSVFDSAVLFLPYNHTFSGDTTKPVTINVYRLASQMISRDFPNRNDPKVSVYNNARTGFYNTSTVSRMSMPLASKTVKFSPSRDSVTIKLPDTVFGKLFSLAQPKPNVPQNQIDSSAYFFTNIANFVNKLFYGLNLEVDPGTDACVVGFDATRLRIRFYYKKLAGDHLVNTHNDFRIVTVDNTGGINVARPTTGQFNHIDFDRSGTPYLGSLQKLKPLRTSSTGNLGFVQSGTGLVMRLDFPRLHDFFTLNSGITLNAAYLEFHPVRGSYPKNFLAPPALQLFPTDDSSLPLSIYGTIPGALSYIHYDYEFGKDTYYVYQLSSFLTTQLRSTTTNTELLPLILGPPGNQGSSVQRVYFGDRYYSSYPETKIKLKLFYSYALN